MNFDRRCSSAMAVAASFFTGLTLSTGCAALMPSRKPPDSAAATAIDSSATDPSSAIDSKPEPAGKPTAADAAAKTPAAKADKASLSDQRQERLRQVSDDFERRRAESQYQAALNRWREDDSAGCRQQLETLLARNSNHHPAHLLMAEVALEQGEPKVALEHTRAVLGSEPNNARAHHLMALALDSLGESSAAVQHYERATSLAPGNEQYAFAYQAALGGAVLPSGSRDGDGVTTVGFDATDVSVAAATADGSGEAPSAGSSGPRDHAAFAAANDRAARADSARDQSAFERRLEEFQRRVAAEPDNLQIVLAEAAYSLRHHRPDVAADIVLASLKRHPEVAALDRMLGAARYQQGDFPAAQVALEQALSLDNTDALAYFLMGSTLARLGNAEAARQHFAEAARLDPRIAQSR